MDIQIPSFYAFPVPWQLWYYRKVTYTQKLPEKNQKIKRKYTFLNLQRELQYEFLSICTGTMNFSAA